MQRYVAGKKENHVTNPAPVAAGWGKQVVVTQPPLKNLKLQKYLHF